MKPVKHLHPSIQGAIYIKFMEQLNNENHVAQELYLMRKIMISKGELEDG